MAAREIPLVRRADDDVVAGAQHRWLFSLAAEGEAIVRIDCAALGASEGHRIKVERHGQLALNCRRCDAGDPILGMDGEDGQRITHQRGRRAHEEVDVVRKLLARFVAGVTGFDPVDPASRPQCLEPTLLWVVQPGREGDVEPRGNEAPPQIEDERLATAQKSLARRVERVVDKSEHPNRLCHNP